MMPFDFRTFIMMFRLAFHDRMSPRRKKVVLALLFIIPAMATLNAFCLLLDQILFPGFRRVHVHKPVFIIGHARSGTSLMHRLMTGDERFSWFMTYELFVPSLVQRKLIRFLGACDRRFAGGALARRIQAWEDRTFARGREMHPMSLTGPEEDEFLLIFSCLSGVWVTLFPYMRELDYLYYTDRMAPRERRRILGFYESCVKRQLYLNGPHRTHCSKNPTFAGKMESLIEIFPDARFVVLNRNPYETIPSLLKMMKRNWKASDCDPERMRDSMEGLGQQSFHTYRYPYEVLTRHPEIRYALVDYRELVESPRRVVEKVYSQLELPLTPEFEKFLALEETRSKEYRADHVYNLREFGLEHEKIRAELGQLFERFGWQKEPPEYPPKPQEGAQNEDV